jgi:hypothetical protein
MSEINVSYDIDTELWKVDTALVDSISCDVYFTFLRSITNGKFNGLSYGLDLFKNEEKVFDYVSSLENLRLINTGKLSTESTRLILEPDTDYELKLWADFQGIKTDNSVNFTTPRPQKPYPSYVWINNMWTAPTPFPTDNRQYLWDESTLSWILEQQ